MYSTYGYGGYDAASAGLSLMGLGCYFFFLLVFYIVGCLGYYKMFVKAGVEGWKAFIPIYNIYIMIKLSGNEWWWLLLIIIPFVGWIMNIFLMIAVAKSYGKDWPYGIGLAFLPFIFSLILGFGSAQYVGPAGSPFSGGSAPYQPQQPPVAPTQPPVQPAQPPVAPQPPVQPAQPPVVNTPPGNQEPPAPSDQSEPPIQQ